MKLFRTPDGPVAQEGGSSFLLRGVDWDALLNRPDLAEFARRQAGGAPPVAFDPDRSELLSPVGSQEVWAAGVTYYRSRDARVEESQGAGGGDFYSRVYEAERPEIFFKATPVRVSGHRRPVRIRRDSKWNVPEPELALFVNSERRIAGYTICNDMSSRDIEGENPLYLPQAKTYDGSCALGPGVLVAEGPLPPSTEIRLEILREGKPAFAGATSLAQIKRPLESLVEWLCRETSFPSGCFFSTGTGIVPPGEFTLRAGDEIRITIPPIGTLSNTVG